jgi:hypothetical protein
MTPAGGAVRQLPADLARCLGYEVDGQWREGCEDCLRRTTPPANAGRAWMMWPPAVVVFECESRIAP